MNKEEIKELIKSGEYKTVKELREQFHQAHITQSGNVEVIIEDWRVMLGKIEGIYKVASITKRNSL